ncbi:hypothetical protein [Cohnella sp.]|uniref:hypothetical protein n=1 Tax=Cohnella sp. TaxID=1883426 RepID=UPI00356A668A
MNYANPQWSQSLHQCEQIVQQLIHQTQQASQNYQMLLQQEQQNAQRLEELAQREQRAAQMIQTALQGHQTAIQQLNQVSNLCRQIEQMAHLQFNASITQSSASQPMNQGFAQPMNSYNSPGSSANFRSMQ